MKEKNTIMKLAARTAKYSMEAGKGGPFGAAVVKDGNIISLAANSVLANDDPTAHAEIQAIRCACRQMKTYDLTGCELYTTSYPCPMCLSAIMWANITKVHYGCTCEDAEDLSFRDQKMYKYIQEGCKDTEQLVLIPEDRDRCIKLFEEYKEIQGTSY